MLSRPTTFVVGAGASREFGLPDGKALKERIAQALDAKWDHSRGWITGDHQIIETLKRANPNSTDWQMACWRIRDGLPGLADSIDNYLDNHREDLHMQRAGRVAIVKLILDAEKQSSLYYDFRQREPLNFSTVENTWLGHLFRTLQRRCHKSEVASFFANCRMIVFNYDRCIEQFFERALTQYYQIGADQAQRIVRDASIVHAYGSIAQLPGHTDNHRETVGFGSTEHNLLQLSEGIRTYADQTSDDVVQTNITEYIRGAHVIAFLGFGFHPQNLDLITRDPVVGAPLMIGSAYEVSSFNTEMYESDLLKRFSNNKKIKPHLANATCGDIMRDFSGAFDR